MKYLPESIDLDDTLANILEGRNLKLPSKMPQDGQNKIEDMMRNFFIIDAPERYI